MIKIMLATLMTKFGVRQREIATLLDLTESAVSQKFRALRHGRISFSTPQSLALAQFFTERTETLVTVDDLFAHGSDEEAVA